MINILRLFNKKENTTVEEYIKVPLKTDLEEVTFYRLINTPFINNQLDRDSLYVTMPYSNEEEVIGVIKNIRYKYIEIKPDIAKYKDILEKSEIHINGIYKNNKMYKILSFYIEPIIKDIDIEKYTVT